MNGTKCKECDGIMRYGFAIWPAEEVGVRYIAPINLIVDGELILCFKCDKCGHSEYMPYLQYISPLDVGEFF